MIDDLNNQTDELEELLEQIEAQSSTLPPCQYMVGEAIQRVLQATADVDAGKDLMTLEEFERIAAFMVEVILTPSARDDAESLFLYHYSFSPNVARTLRKEIIMTAHRLRLYPETGLETERPPTHPGVDEFRRPRPKAHRASGRRCQHKGLRWYGRRWPCR